MGKDKCPCCGEEMTFPIGTRVVIVDNFDEHIGYKQGTICKIVEITDDGYYVLDSGHWCSEAEIKEVKRMKGKEWEKITGGMKQEDKSENHIKVPIFYYEDDNGKKVYDYEEMDLEYQMEKDKLEKKEAK